MEEMTLYNKIVSSGIDFIIDGLSAYGSEWSAKNICLCIEEKDEKIKKFLISLNNCGMYEFLVAICEITPLYNFFIKKYRTGLSDV